MILPIVKDIQAKFSKEQVKASLVDRYAYAGDAGFYYLLPIAIVFPATIADIKALFILSQQHQIPLTFRTAGTSLSGQSITDGILVIIGKDWKNIRPLANGNQVSVGPGAIGAHVNHCLASFGKKIGPDPASIAAAMMGGILSNNSSGMCCGVLDNAYHTLDSISFVLPNGHAYQTADAHHRTLFLEQDATIAQGITALRNRILAMPELVQQIRRKYQIKNTVGYSINAFLDYEHPLDIFSRLLIGAEGTLAFISEAVLNTIPQKTQALTGILYFSNPVAAAESIDLLKSTGAAALEFMDRAALRSVEHLADCPPNIKSLPESAAAILCEYQEDQECVLDEKLPGILNQLHQLPLLSTPSFTKDKGQQAKLWKLRKGMYPSVAAVRAKGTTAMLEDIAVPFNLLGATIHDLQGLFKKFNYHNAIIFGHAKEGNLHFLITQSVNEPEEISQFQAFNAALADLIIHQYKGSLKAEHGTGRQIAPFVKEEWGEAAYEIMQDLKKLVDPHGLLNPGVIINADPACHLKNLKTMPIVESEVDKCVECGYCEPKCPSKDFTLSPRQRIQIRRSLQRLASEGDRQSFDQLTQEFQFSGMDSCAVDGICATECPVGINTGDLIKRLRRENHHPRSNQWAVWMAKHFHLLETIVTIMLKMGIGLNQLLGANSMKKITQWLKKWIPGFPIWLSSIEKPIAIKSIEEENPAIVYFPTCITRMMGGHSHASKSIDQVVVQLCKKAKISLRIPEQINGVCCGQVFASKGLMPAYQQTVNHTIEQWWKWSDQGQIPILLDVTSCTQSILNSFEQLTPTNQEKFKQLNILDSIDFAADILLPKLSMLHPKSTILFHPVCSSYKMDLIPKIKQIGAACATNPIIPFLSSCCGMAGDRGFYYPELIQSANHALAAEINQLVEKGDCQGFYSSGKTCEMALTATTGQPYQSILYLLDEVSD